MFRRSLTSVLALLCIVLSGCDETDAVAIRIRLRPDFGGTVTTSALETPPSPGAVADATQGAQWDAQVHVACASGKFESLSALRVADVTFQAGEAGDGLCFVKVTLPRGPAVRWAQALVPLTMEERARAAAALDPTGKARDVGATVKFEVELPANVIGNGLSSKPRGTKAKSEGGLATLIVPTEIALAEGDAIVWHLTWQR